MKRHRGDRVAKVAFMGRPRYIAGALARAVGGNESAAYFAWRHCNRGIIFAVGSNRQNMYFIWPGKE